MHAHLTDFVTYAGHHHGHKDATQSLHQAGHQFAAISHYGVQGELFALALLALIVILATAGIRKAIGH